MSYDRRNNNNAYMDTVYAIRPRTLPQLIRECARFEDVVQAFPLTGQTLDPTGGHGLGGDVKTINRYRKYEEYLLRTLGRFERGAAEPASAAPVDASATTDSTPVPSRDGR